MEYLKIVLLWVPVLLLYKYSRHRKSLIPIDQIGFVWAFVLALYTTVPVIGWLAQGRDYGFLSYRLLSISSSIADTNYIIDLSIAHMYSFALVYYIVNRYKKTRSHTRYKRISKGKIVSALSLIVVTGISNTILRLLGIIRGAESYLDSYKVIQDLPLVVRQLVKISNYISLVAFVVVVIGLMQRWPRSSKYLFAYLAVTILTFDVTGSRILLVMQFFAIAVAWHLVVRPITGSRFALMVTSGITIFASLSVIRVVGSIAAEGVEGFLSLGGGEFNEVWTNAIHLTSLGDGINIEDRIRYSELFSFIPSQLLWFDKSNLSLWYVSTFYPVYFEQGGGLAFGAIAQAVIGGGMVEAVVRGSVVGLLSSGAMVWLRLKSRKWWALPAHIYILVISYESIRESTFAPLGKIVQVLIPGLIFIYITSKFFDKGRKYGISRRIMSAHKL